MKDLLIEIWSSLRRNKLRTVLTGFAVFWGIFMLIVLLGAGNGLINSFNQDAGDIQVNTMMIGGGYTSEPYGGYRAGRQIEMKSGDMDLLKKGNLADKIDRVTATVSSYSMSMAYGTRHLSVSLSGVFPEYSSMERVKLLAGRFINETDMTKNRKVVVLSSNQVENFLAGDKDYQKIIGKRVKFGNLSFLIIGVNKVDDSSMSSTVYVPFSTVKTVFSKGEIVDDITFSFNGIKTEAENTKFEEDLVAKINLAHNASPTDKSAVWVWNRFEQSMQMDKASSILNTSMWIIGLLTLLSGIVGVSNIMLITVKERTHEFGIRKAIGATPWSITRLIVTESVMITAFFGYIGMASGMIVCEIMDNTIGQQSMDVFGEKMHMLINPTVGIDVAIEATIVLIIAGTAAGLFPARKAARIKPIEALRAD
jgi:putative ABC transport system permease protein